MPPSRPPCDALRFAPFAAVLPSHHQVQGTPAKVAPSLAHPARIGEPWLLHGWLIGGRPCVCRKLDRQTTPNAPFVHVLALCICRGRLFARLIGTRIDFAAS